MGVRVESHDGENEKQDAADAEARIESSRLNVQAMEAIVQAYAAQVESYEAVKTQLASAGKAAVASVPSKIEPAKKRVVADQVAWSQLSAEYDRVKGQYAEGLTSQQKLQQAEVSYKEADAKLAQSKASLEALYNEMTEKQNEVKAKETKAQVDVDYTKATLAKAMSDVVKAGGEVAKAEADWANAQIRIEEWNIRLARLETFQIAAPFDGRVTELTRQQFIRDGDPICTLTPQSSDQVPKESNSVQSVTN